MEEPSSPVSFRLNLDKKSLSLFTPLLQRGIRVKAQVGGSLKGLLEDQFGLSPEYLKERIKTVLLDGKPVDDWDTALVRDGTVLALSAAMPGLAGATLRRGGFFAAMRSQIPQPERITSFLPEDGLVVVKLFNLLIPELGPFFLQRGIFVSREEFAELRKSMPDEFGKGGIESEISGEGREENHLRGLEPPSNLSGFFLSVHFF
jgi:hypothetical protein